MNWAQIANKNSEEKLQNNKKDTSQSRIISNTDYIKSYENKELNAEELFNLYKNSDILEDLFDIKEDVNKYTPWILSNARSYDIYQFIYKYIDYEASLPKDSYYNRMIDDDSDDGIIDDVYT